MNHRLPLIVVAALVLVGCGSSGDASTTAGSTAATSSTPAAATETSPVAGSSEAVFNAADVQFAQDMVPHHEQAIVMADLALDPSSGASPDVVALAERIKAAQGPEVEMMSGWLAAWGQPMAADTGHEGHDMGSMEGMSGMMSTEEMAQLSNARGAGFDPLWLEMMIRHHQGALDMAELAIADASNPDVIKLADDVMLAQQSEIDEMTQLLAG